MARTKILLIDDERDFREVVAVRLESWGYEVVAASSGREGIEALKSKGADIVVLDYIMPGMDGVLTLRKLRKIDADIPVVMFTAYPDTRSVKGAMDLNISAYVPKLSDHADTQAALKAALKMARKNIGKGA